MSRKKSSRKQGSAPRAKPKLSKHELESVEKRVRKKTGKKPGNKQVEGNVQKDKKQTSLNIKDPRIGSKIPILLGESTSIDKKVKKPKVKVSTESILGKKPILLLDKENELDDIQNDERLLLISAKQDDDIALTSEEVDYYNLKMDHYHKLQAEIGVDEEKQDENIKDDANSEDDLWDRLDNPNFKEY